MKKLIIWIVSLFFIPLILLGQNNSNQKVFPLQKLHSNKIRYFKQGTYFGFIIKDACIDSNCKGKFNLIQGQLISISDSGIVIDLTYQETRTSYNDSIVEVKLYADFVPVPNNKQRILIPNNNIQYIKYSPKSRVSMGLLGSAGLLTAAIIAPLISINYSTGTFNSSIYFSTVVPSLITATISFATYFSFHTRKFKTIKNK
jgi:hypothetical protein